MKKLLTICLMLLGVVAQAQNFAITATTEAAIRKNIVKGNAANYGFGMINDTLKLVGLTTRNVIFTGSTSKTDIGLGNVDNTSDANKPVSSATQTALNLKQNQLNGTGFIKATGTTISYDNSTYLSTSTASSTYLPINNPTATGTLTAPTISNSLGANFATTSGNVGVGTSSPLAKLDIRGDTHVSNGSGIKTRYRTGGVIDFTNFAESAYADAAITGNTLSLFGNNGTGLYVNSSGNVGIGTTSIGSPLQVLKGAAGSEVARFLNAGGYGIRIIAQTGGSGVNSSLGSASGESISINPNNIESTRFFSNGRVGINTTTDAGYLLDVNGTARFSNSSLTGGIEIGQTGFTAKIQYNTNGNLDITPRSGYNTIFTAGNVGIGTTSPAASAILDITSTTKGVLFPRMTTDQINAISSPASGLTVYNTTLLVLCFYDGTGWRKVSHSSM